MRITTALDLKKGALLAQMEIKIVDAELAELEANPPPLAQLRARAEELRRELQDTVSLDGRQALSTGEAHTPNLRDLEILVAELAKDPAETHSTRRLGTCLRSLADNVDPLPASLRCDSPGCTRLGVPGGLTGELTLCSEHERQHEQRARAEAEGAEGDDEDEDEEADVRADVHAAKPSPTRDKPGTLAERILADPQTSVDWRAVGVRAAKTERASRPSLSRMTFADQVEVIVGTVIVGRWGRLQAPLDAVSAIREGVRAELAGAAQLTNAVLEGAARRPAPEPADAEEVEHRAEEDGWRVGSRGAAPKNEAEVERRINRILAKGPKSRLVLAQAVGFWDGSTPLFARVLKRMGRAKRIYTEGGFWRLTNATTDTKAADKTPAAARP